MLCRPSIADDGEPLRCTFREFPGEERIGKITLSKKSDLPQFNEIRQRPRCKRKFADIEIQRSLYSFRNSVKRKGERCSLRGNELRPSFSESIEVIKVD